MMLRPFLVAAAAAVVLSLLGGAATQIGPWYEGLAKPSWNPPNWVFGPVWTTIYALAVVAAARGWHRSETPREKGQMLALFLANGCLNVLWSMLFFTFQRPDWALYEVGFLWLSILALIVFLAPRDKLAASLLSPYLLWVGFAAYLNYRIAALNGPY